MIETIVKVDGMMCGMCEGHINDAIRSHFQVKKVSSSHSKGRTVIRSQEALDQAQQAHLGLAEDEADGVHLLQQRLQQAHDPQHGGDPGEPGEEPLHHARHRRTREDHRQHACEQPDAGEPR